MHFVVHKVDRYASILKRKRENVLKNAFIVGRRRGGTNAILFLPRISHAVDTTTKFLSHLSHSKHCHICSDVNAAPWNKWKLKWKNMCNIFFSILLFFHSLLWYSKTKHLKAIYWYEVSQFMQQQHIFSFCYTTFFYLHSGDIFLSSLSLPLISHVWE